MTSFGLVSFGCAVEDRLIHQCPPSQHSHTLILVSSLQVPATANKISEDKEIHS